MKSKQKHKLKVAIRQFGLSTDNEGETRLYALLQKGNFYLTVGRVSLRNLHSNDPSKLFISNLIVAPSYRRQKVGTFLMKQIIKLYGYNKLELTCYDHLVSFYKTLGFALVRRFGLYNTLVRNN